MNTTLRSILIVIAVVVIGAALFLGGVAFGRLGVMGYGPAWMMTGVNPNTFNQSGYGMMGSGMMGGYGSGMMGGGMMGGSGSTSLYGVKPLSIPDAQKAVEGYLAGLSNDDLALGEVMVFDNQAYAIVVEKSTGVGAFEVLVDPATQGVYPEPGPNMMWNLKYGMMAGSAGGGSGMMGGYANQGQRGMMGGAAIPDVSAQMPVSEEQALQTAQAYLDATLPGVKVEDEADAFYGYYTIDIQRDGKIVGMLSVNGYNSQVFLHTWHGDFIEMSGK
jgi:hypothetical protein